MGKHSRSSSPAPATAVSANAREPALVGSTSASPPTRASLLPAESAASPRLPLPPVPTFRSQSAEAAAHALTPPAPTTRAPARRPAGRTRHRGRRRLIAGAVVVAVLAATAGVLPRRHRSARPATAVVAPGPAARSQATVLFALDDPGGDEAALLAADPVQHSGSVALLPSRLVTSVPGSGQLPLGQAVATPDQGVASAAVSDLLGVTVDGSWRVDAGAFAHLVDAVGGVQVTVDREITGGGAVVLSAGPQRLAGAAAVQFAQSLADNEDESARLARVQAVLDALLAGLPAGAQQLQDLLAASGGGSVSTLPLPRLAQVLEQLRSSRSAATSPLFTILPVLPLDAGGGAPSYRVDDKGLAAYVSANLAASVPPGARAGGVRVFVYNGTLAYGVGTAARARLVAAGMSFVGSRNDTSSGRDTSVVLVKDATPQSRTQGERVAAALGLPASALQVAPAPQDVADVVVITGADFKP